MKRYAPVQFRTSSMKESSMSFRMTLPDGISSHVCFDDFEAMMVYAKNDVCRTVLKTILYADSVKAETKGITQKLLSASCLNIHQHRVITFESTDWVMINNNEFLLYGNLTMCGCNKFVVFEVRDSGINTTSENARLTKLEINGLLRLSDFKIKSVSDPADAITLHGLLVFKNEVTSILQDI